ncbi:MAG: sigma-70 family RNA polymerase sigma factor [Terracidiphilus sp.]
MQWETAIPNPLAGEATHPACQPMDADAFAGFYERSARPLWAYLARVAADGALAEDLMQESYVRFLTADHPAEGEVAARKYLFRIATNLLRDHWRRPRTASLEETPESLLASGAATGEWETLVGPALNRLSPRDRQLLWLAYAEGYSHREIAEITGLASAGIRLLLFRARRRMAALLRPNERREP